MKHLGDITKIDGHTAPVVDVVIGGSPCQDLSVAGRRAGLAGERSGLFMEQIRIAKEMREEDRKRGRTGNAIRPRIMVWENVPGAFSSNHGEDFKAVLEEVIRIGSPDAPDIPLPPKGKWPLADAYYGDGWSVAYRVLDAQFWGVPQRRRRIALVADFGGHAAPEILFVRQSVQGDIAEVGTEREENAVAPGSGSDVAIALRMRAGCAGGGKGPLIQIEKSGTLGCNNDQTIFCLMDQGGSVMETMMDKTGTLRAQEHGHQPIVLTFPEGVANTILAKAQLSYRGDQDTLVLTYDARGNGDGKTACTLTGDHQNRITDYTSLVLAFKAGQGAKAGGLGIQEDVAPTLTSAESGTNQVPVVLLVTPSVAAVDCRNGTVDPNFNGTLQAKSNGGQSLNLNNVVLTTAADGTILLDGHPCIVIRLCVRRLTPLECERLQGYPDGWTDIGPWVDSKGKLHKECSDSARYKALGNSIALPHWKWILKRISAIYEREATMASLFDGIGGFPLLWEQINGAGSCLWASEIEEFPMEVTRYRIGSGV